MKTIAFIAAVAIATVAVSAASAPAFAQATGQFGNAKVRHDAKTDRYCFSEAITGSRVPLVQCRTKAQWAQAGLTITRKAAVQIAQR
ncbi:hypothetical protein Q4610_10020 [Sphingobium sp. HBC34]|uniref:Uncharacterized protein n=1 Tax=Sphingobium cyanobacteriorum TaxID=3063954 RepID=A0ABT8ZLF6_9SPHN|nr:hypothetical protein [Sphingobium sp. HBC34]MDO7835382.1 hypothetical protein [Sphingobium sp. HBC34]